MTYPDALQLCAALRHVFFEKKKCGYSVSAERISCTARDGQLKLPVRLQVLPKKENMFNYKNSTKVADSQWKTPSRRGRIAKSVCIYNEKLTINNSEQLAVSSEQRTDNDSEQ